MSLFPQFNWRKPVASIVIATVALVSAIAGYEGYSSVAYPDPAQPKNEKLVTIGYGHTGGVKLGDKITQEEAVILLVEDINKHWNQMKRYIKVPLHQYEAEAYTSFSYNVGVGNFKNSTLLKLLNQKQYLAACKQLPRWNKAGGKVMNGLIARRKDEYQMCVGKSQKKALAVVQKYMPANDPVYLKLANGNSP